MKLAPNEIHRASEVTLLTRALEEAPDGLSPPADHTKDYFPHLRELAEAHRGVIAEALTEMTRKGAPENVKRAAGVLLLAGRILNRTVAKTKDALDAGGITDEVIDKSLDDAWDLVRGLKGVRDSTALPGPLRDLLGVTRRNRIRRDLYAVTASELRTDLSAALVGYEQKDSKRATHGRIDGVDRVLLVIDDYEAVHNLLGDFLIGALVPALAAAPFKAVFVIVGRDDLESTHPGWAQHCRRYLREQIRLSPFDETAAHAMFAAAAIPEEWFSRICYLDRIDEDTLGAMFPSENISKIQDWFEREPSVRDPSAPYFRVRPMVREKMLRYLEVRAPSRHRELTAKANSSREHHA